MDLMSSTLQSRFFSLAGLLIGILGCYLAFNGFNYQEFKTHFSLISQRYVFLSFLILLLSVWVRALRWKFIINDSDNLKTFTLFKFQLIGIFGNYIFPMKSGELLRAHVSAKGLNKSRGHMLGTIITERVMDALFVVILTLILVNSFGYSFSSKPILILLSTIVIILLFVWIYRRKKNRPQIIDGISSFYKSNYSRLIILTILIWLLIVIDINLIGIAFGMQMNLLNILVILCAITLGFSVPTPLPGNLGIVHSAIISSMTFMGHGESESIAFAIILHAHGFILFTILGGLCMLLNSLSE